MKKFCESLFEHIVKIPLTNEEYESYLNQINCHISKKEKFENKYNNIINYHKVKDHYHYTDKYRCDARSICSLKYSIPGGNPVVFHIRSNYDYHFIIRGLAKEFGGEYSILGEKH